MVLAREVRVVLILGIDPGPRLHGYALLDVTRERRLHVSSGRATTDELVCCLPTQAFDVAEVVGVEWSDRVLGGFGDHQRSRSIAAALIATQGEAGILVGRASATTRVERIEASSWRRGILGTSSPTDAQVRAAILRLVEGWPRRSSAGAHACDAAGVALAAFNMARGSRREEVA